MPETAENRFSAAMIARAAVLGGAYWLTVVLAIELVSPVEKIALFWPPNAIAAAALVFFERRHWPLFIIAMALAFFAGRIPSGDLPSYVYAVFCAANVIEILIVAEAVKRFGGGPVTHQTLTQALPVVMLAMIPASLVSAAIGATAVARAIEGATVWGAAVDWFTSDLSGLLLVLPVLIAWLAPGAPAPGSYGKNEIIERTAIAVALVASGLAIPLYLGHVIEVGQISLIYPYLVFPVLVWTALRTGIRSTVVATLAAGLFAVFLTYLGQGPFDVQGFSASGQIALMKAGLIVITLTTIFISVGVVQRKRAEEALVESRRILQSVIDSVPAVINAKDRASRYIFMNRYQADLYGVTPEAAIGKTAADLVGETYGIYTNAIDTQVLSTNRPKRNYEETWVDPDGLPHALLTTKVPLEDDTGAVAAVVTVSLDISQRVQAEEERRHALVKAEEASQAKSEFLATISHELRTPLNAILGFAGILSHQYLGKMSEEKYSEYADDIYASGQYLLDLVNDILDISTIEAGKRSLFKESISIAEEIDDCVKAVVGNAENKGIAVSADVPDGLPPVIADRRAIRQILLNLLTNAIKFSRERGTVVVSAGASARDTIIKVIDDGVGIEGDRIALLMAPFVRGEANPYVTRDGVGLGLAITQSLVELHGGTLEITSDPGKGTTVTVALPNAAP